MQEQIKTNSLSVRGKIVIAILALEVFFLIATTSFQQGQIDAQREALLELANITQRLGGIQQESLEILAKSDLQIEEQLRQTNLRIDLVKEYCEGIGK